MPVNAQDIAAEHQAALASLTKEQHRALSRVQRAYQESHFNHHRISENLERIFEDEAKRRNEAEAVKAADEGAGGGRAEDGRNA